MLLLLSHSDTDLLSARAAGGPVEYRFANPARLPLAELPGLLDGAELVVVRLLGGLRSWEEGLDAVRAAGKPVVVLSGEQAPDAQLMEASTVPIGVATEAHAYLAHGGPGNLEQLARFLSDTVLLTGHGFEAPAAAPTWGPLERTARTTAGPTVAVLYYRAHHMSGNTGFVDTLCSAIEDTGAQALPLYVASCAPPNRNSSTGSAPPTRSSPPSSPRAAPSPRRRRPAVTRRPGTRARSPPSTCRSSRRSA